MFSWQNILKTSPIEWLLEQENPSVRYFTLRDLLDRNKDAHELQAAKALIPTSKLITKIFSKQKPEGYWEKPTSPYHPKYKSSYWTIMLLSQLGIDRSDKRVKNACEHIFQFQLNDGGFSSYTLERALKEYEWLLGKRRSLPSPSEWASSLVFEHQYSCLTGNMTATLIRLSYKDDSRVKKTLEWLVKTQNEDGGWLCPYWKAHIKDTHSCFFGTICPLEAFSEVPRTKRTKNMARTIENGVEFMLMHRLFKADHHGFKIIKSDWLKFGFPLFYRYDILRGLLVMAKLGYSLKKDKCLNDAVEVLLQKRCPDGKWVLENTPSGRMQANIEVKGKPSKWITLNALRALKYLSTDN
jgi:hypothetical protein